MQFKLLSALALLGAVSASPSVEKRQAGFCAEAARFGNVVASPTTLSPGDVSPSRPNICPRHALTFGTICAQELSVTSNFTCSFTKGIEPKFIDYFLEVLIDNNGHEAPLLLERRVFDASAGPIDQFSTPVST